MSKVQKAKAGQPSSAIKTWCRACAVYPEMVGLTFTVHNGKDFITVKIIEEMVGHRLGEFAPTRKFRKHGGKKQREIEKGQVSANAAPPQAGPTKEK